MRKAFGRKTSSDELTVKRTKSQKAELYRVGDWMPAPKYPGRYNKPHQDILRAFSFSSHAAGRRRSEQIDVSPRASCAPSRRNSGMDGLATKAVSSAQRPRRVVEEVDGDDDPGHGTCSHGALCRGRVLTDTVPSSQQLASDRDPRRHQDDPEPPRPTNTTSSSFPHTGHSAKFDQHQMAAALKQSSVYVPSIGGYC